jgi:glutathione S-transferase
MIFFQKPILMKKSTKLSPEARTSIDSMLSTLEQFLGGSKYFCGDNKTIADIAIFCSLGLLFVSV